MATQWPFQRQPGLGPLHAVVGWLIIQVVDVVSEPLSLPASLDTVVIVLVAEGFPIALVLAWAFDVKPEGVVRTPALDAAGPALGFRDERA